MSFKKLKIRLINELDANQVELLSESINYNIELASKDFKLEYEATIEKLLKKNDINEFHTQIIEWKNNYLKSQTTEYGILKKYSNEFLVKLDKIKTEDISKLALTFYQLYKITAFSKVDNFIVNFSKEVFHFHKNELFYDLGINLIKTFNQDITNPVKLPQIQKFETESFRLIKGKYDNLITEYYNLKEKYIKEVNKLTNENINSFEKFKKEIFKLEDSLREKKRKYDDLLFENEGLVIQLKSNENYIEIFKQELSKKDYNLNPQFDNLLWGDNYPALKVLYNFLIANQIYVYSWSYFALQMSLGNLELIQLCTGNYTKRELGYLLYEIRPFFTHDYKNTQKRYLEVIKRKFAIDEVFVNDTFCKNNIRGYKKSKELIKSKKEIDFLCSNIASRYI